MSKKKLKNHVTQKKKNTTSGHWKGGKRKHYTYEGGQYTGGREKGRKNLKKLVETLITLTHYRECFIARSVEQPCIIR